MKQYIETKLIEAEPCPAWKDVGGHKTGDPGYKVRYADGYESWSPKDVFEEAYRPVSGMSFGLAIEAAKRGMKIKRCGWNGKDQYVELASGISYKNASGEIVNVDHQTIGNKAFAFVGTSGVQMGWLASQADMLADDWEIVQDAAEADNNGNS